MKNLPSAARKNKIRERFSSHPGVSISELAREFDVSEMTIRRDLTSLEKETHIQRTHGGAVLTERMILEFDYRDRRELNREHKRAIAEEARKLVAPGDRLILDTGTTTLELATLLRDGVNLTVITPSLAVASELQHAPGVEVILLGGTIRRGSPDLTGPATEHCLELFSADIAFQGADGIGADGKIYNSDLRLARVDKLMRKVAKRSCILADHTKVGQTALACSGTLADVDTFITTKGIPADTLRRFAKLCPQIITVSSPTS
ncbi:DeoR/GlpR family DNA-binding transcription regulator [Oleiharenicola lentus]|uniref:DeoR/GlpR family DNA-binding transcription regulator n=1 Tax=Oleiharenicola lentus TaxID=2508720 RepID=UPI003F682171